MATVIRYLGKMACSSWSHGNVSYWRTFSLEKRPSSRVIETYFHLNNHSILSRMSNMDRY